MKPRPTRSRKFYSVYRILILLIFLKDVIAAQPTSSRIPTKCNSRPQNRALENRPHQLPPCDCTKPATGPKTPQPVFFPYTVPIPWPTPFNGTDYAPVPSTIQAKIPVFEPRNDYAYPLYMPYPQLQFVPFYFHGPSPSNSPNADSTIKKETLPAKPVKKPVSDSCPIDISPPTHLTQPPTKPLEKPTHPIYGDIPPPKDYVPPSKHTWVPPPEDLLDEIPPAPSVLHTRSPASPYGPKAYDSRPEFNGFADERPDRRTYYPEPKPYNPHHHFASRPTYYETYSHRPVEKVPYVTYGPEFVTYSEHPRNGANDAYFTYGPNVVTYTENAPVSSYPTRPSYATSQSRYPYQVKQPHSSPWEYRPPKPYSWECQSPRPAPRSAPRPTSIGSRSSVFPPPPQDDPRYVYYEPDIITIVDDYHHYPYPSSPPPIQQPVSIGGRSGIPAPPAKPKKTGNIGYVIYEPEVFNIADDDVGEQSITYGPNTVTLIEDFDEKPVEEPGAAYVETQPGYYTFTDPEDEFFENTPMDVPQPLVHEPPPSSFADLLSDPETTKVP